MISRLNNDLTEYAKIKNGKIYGYNSETEEYDKEIKTMPIPNYSNVLYVFDKDKLSFKATEDGFLIGSLPCYTWAGNYYVTINGNKVTNASSGSANRTASNVYLPFAKGDTIALNAFDTNYMLLICYGIR